LNLHEYQAKQIFNQNEIPIPREKIAQTAQGASNIAEEFATKVVVKAQVHTGGRGKAGGIKLANNPDEAFEHANEIIGMSINDLTVRTVLVAEAVNISHESYVGIILDRQTRQPVVMVSPAGGVDIEEVARETPEKIYKVGVDPLLGLQPYQARALAYKLYSESSVVNQVSGILLKLYNLFILNDMSLVEINPLVTDLDGQVWALDGKVNIDDNALFRHSEIESLRDPASEEPTEAEAREADLSFVKLDGDIGCIVNGAGLAMATMDLVKFYGGLPANFLDIGGSSNPDKVVAAMKIITADKKVKAILFNIFGGITRCDDVANGIVTALDRIGVSNEGAPTLPIVIRLTGTNEEVGREILKSVGLVAVDTMAEAVQMAVSLGGGAK